MEKSTRKLIAKFVAESNAIESINREPTEEEIDQLEEFLCLKTVTMDALRTFVWECSGAKLRCIEGLDVTVGNHTPPRGGPNIKQQVRFLLDRFNLNEESPYELHQCYEALHPFMDGNGRSGRALWAWQMHLRGEYFFTRGFLHTWYYQSLDEGRKIPNAEELSVPGPLKHEVTAIMDQKGRE